MTVKCRSWTSPATKTGGWKERLNVLEGLTVLWWVTPIINGELPITIFHHEHPLIVRFFEANVIWAFVTPCPTPSLRCSDVEPRSIRLASDLQRCA